MSEIEKFVLYRNDFQTPASSSTDSKQLTLKQNWEYMAIVVGSSSNTSLCSHGGAIAIRIPIPSDLRCESCRVHIHTSSGIYNSILQSSWGYSGHLRSRTWIERAYFMYLYGLEFEIGGSDSFFLLPYAVHLSSWI